MPAIHSSYLNFTPPRIFKAGAAVEGDPGTVRVGVSAPPTETNAEGEL